MSLYIVFDNLWSLMEASQSADLADNIETAVSRSVSLAGVNASEVTKVAVSVETDGKILLKVDNSAGNAAPAIDYDKAAVALISQTLAAVVPPQEQQNLLSTKEKTFVLIEEQTSPPKEEQIPLPIEEKILLPKEQQFFVPIEEKASPLNIEVLTQDKVNTEILSQDKVDEVVNEIFVPSPEKFEISFRYIIDQADIFRSRQETENSGSLSKLAKENIEKERAAQNRQAERRFQEKQAENLKECLKQKRFVTQLRK